MISSKQLKEFRARGYPEEVIQKTEEFLKKNEYSLLYLTFLGAGEWRIIWRDDKNDKSGCEIFSV